MATTNRKTNDAVKIAGLIFLSLWVNFKRPFGFNWLLLDKNIIFKMRRERALGFAASFIRSVRRDATVQEELVPVAMALSIS